MGQKVAVDFSSTKCYNPGIPKAFGKAPCILENVFRDNRGKLDIVTGPIIVAVQPIKDFKRHALNTVASNGGSGAEKELNRHLEGILNIAGGIRNGKNNLSAQSLHILRCTCSAALDKKDELPSDMRAFGTDAFNAIRSIVNGISSICNLGCK